MDRGDVRKLTLYGIAFVSGDVASQIGGIAVAWHVFVLHHRPFDLGLVGLTLFAPAALLVLVTGLVADRFDRKTIVILAVLAEIGAVGLFLGLVLSAQRHLLPYLVSVLITGTARAFGAPAERGMLLSLIAERQYMRVSAAYSSVRALVTAGGPAAGGALVAIGTPVALVVCAGLLGVGVAGIMALPLRGRTPDGPRQTATLADALGGLRFIRSQPVILAAISLDLFAVLLGGATALLPAYADTILHVGPAGLGLLRSAPAAGAFASAAYLARKPLAGNVGRTLLVAVTVFGGATIVFGVSRNLGLSLAALGVLGAADMISVVIRTGLVQLATPDAMRGRVNAVENVFIGASNELGEFESGTLAAFIGVVPAVVAGGVATLGVVALAFALFPALRRFDRFARAAG